MFCHSSRKVTKMLLQLSPLSLEKNMKLSNIKQIFHIYTKTKKKLNTSFFKTVYYLLDTYT